MSEVQYTSFYKDNCMLLILKWIIWIALHINIFEDIESGGTTSSNLLLPTTPAHHNSDYYLMVYGIIAAANSVFTLFRAFMFAYGGIKAAKLMHNRLLMAVMEVRNVFWLLFIKCNIMQPW